MGRRLVADATRAGVLPVDKPEGPTSHDLVAAARRRLGTRRVGHTGTLDPFASGLLLLCIGWATRLAEYLSALPKTYAATALLGVSTATDDRTGDVVATSDAWRERSAAEVERAFASLVGPSRQVPPRYSAKKVGGERMYRRARRGEAPELESVPIVVHRLEIVEYAPPMVRFEADVSSGTYVRALARDAGERLGTGAHLVSLRRLRIGPHDVADAIGLAELEDERAVVRACIAPLDAIAHLPTVEVDDRAAADLRHGVAIAARDTAPANGAVAISRRGRLLAIAEHEAGRLRPRKVFPGD